MSLSESVLEGKYELVRPISEGGMGRVYLVRHRLLDELRVIKVIHQQHAEDPELQKRFLHEARAATRVRHSRIAETYDFSIDEDGTAYIVMEYIEGKTLQEILRDGGPPPLAYALEIAIQTLEGLDYLHRRGYVHRDVAPDNAMLSRDFEGRPRVKLIDLGIAKRMGEKTGAGVTASGMFLGKARYSSPEQFGRGEVDQRSDLYSFGVVLYELLTGWCPLQGTTLSQLISAHLFEPPIDFGKTDPKKRVPAELRALILQSLAKDPIQRIASARAFIERLRGLRAAYCPQQDWKDLESLLTVRARPLPSDFVFEPTQPMTTPPQPRDPLLIPRALLQARQQIEDGRLDEARQELHLFLVEEPSSQPASELLQVVEEKLQKIEGERRGAITRQAEHIEHLLTEGSLEKARSELEQAIIELGEVELFRALGAKIDRAASEREERLRREEEEQRLETERLEKIEQQAVEIRQLLQDGDLEHADKTLVAAMSELGAAAVWDELLQDLEGRALKQRKRRRRAAQEIEASRQHLAVGELELARSKAVAAREFNDDDTVRRLLMEIEAAERMVAEQRERERQQTSAVARIEWKLAASDFGRATELLDDSLSLFDSDDERASQLRERITVQRQEARQEQFAELLVRARRYREENDFENAAAVVRKALELEPENKEAQRLLLELEADFEAWVREQAQQAARRRLVEEIEVQLEEGRLDEAQAALSRLVFEHDPGAADLQKLSERLEKLERAARKAREKQIIELLQEAQIKLEQQAFEEALEQVRAALDLDPEAPGLREVLQEIESACQDALERRAEENTANEETEPVPWAEVVEKIASLLDSGNSALALQLLSAAERDYGMSPFRRLRARLEEREEGL